MIFELSCFSFYAIDQDVSLTPIYISAGNTLTLDQLVTKNIRTRRASNNLSLQQFLTVKRSITNLSVGNALSLQQIAQKTAISINIYQGLILWQTVKRPIWQKINQSLPLVQTLIGHGTKGTNNPLALNQSIGLQIIRNISIVHPIVWSGTVAAYGQGSQFILPVVPAPNPQTLVTFTYGSFTFDVRAPDWNDSQKLEFSRIDRRSRGGDLIIYRDPNWPESICLKMQFIALTEAQSQLFKKLYRMSIGKMIQYDDHLGQSWAGILLNPAEPIVQTGREQWSVNIELQGSQI